MKHRNGRAPTVKQKKLLKSAGLNIENWLVVSETPEQLQVKHRISGNTRIIRKEWYR